MGPRVVWLASTEPSIKLYGIEPSELMLSIAAKKLPAPISAKDAGKTSL